MKVLIALAALFTVAVSAQAADIQQSKMNSYYVRLDKVTEVVKVRLKREITRSDCNQVTISGTFSKLANGGFPETVVANFMSMATEMYCPQPPVKETIYTDWYQLQSKNSMLFNVIVPEEYEVEWSNQ